MARPQKELEGEGPVVDFARELRKLHQEAGAPKSKQMEMRSAAHVDVSRVGASSFTDAMRGERFPTWRTVESFVVVCGGDLAYWGERWQEVKREVEASRVPQPRPEPLPVLEGELLSSRRRRTGLASVAGVAVLAAVGAGWFALRDEPGEPITKVVIEVQNKSAIGTQLVEDSSPAFLQSEPVTGCRKRGCVVPGSNILYSGDTLVARCWVKGAEFTNADLGSDGIQDNPGRATSDLWYWASMPGGISGFITEVYVVSQHRGGMGLPKCAASPVVAPTPTSPVAAS